MEAFTLLKYWHAPGDTTICPAVAPCKVISPYSDHNGGRDDGPFFDLEFSLTALEKDDEWEEGPEAEAESESGVEGEFLDKMDCLEFVLENGDCLIEKNEERRQGKGNSKGPLVSLFARENNPMKDPDSDSVAGGSHDGRVRKQVVHKYLKLVKPLYSIERMKCGSGRVRSPVGSGGLSPPLLAVAGKGVEVPSHQRQGSATGNNLQSGLKVVMKHLGKSRSSSALVAAPSGGRRRRSNDSMLELQDGIQGAILHCKRSYSMPTPRGVDDI